MNERPDKIKAANLDDIQNKLNFIFYTSTDDDYIRLFDYYEKAYVEFRRSDFLRHRFDYDFFKNRNHYGLYGIKGVIDDE